jgi:hypothetical protein
MDIEGIVAKQRDDIDRLAVAGKRQIDALTPWEACVRMTRGQAEWLDQA